MSSPVTTVIRSIEIPTDGDTAYLEFAISCEKIQALHTISVHKRDAEKIVHIGDILRRVAKGITSDKIDLSPQARQCFQESTDANS